MTPLEPLSFRAIDQGIRTSNGVQILNVSRFYVDLSIKRHFIVGPLGGAFSWKKSLRVYIGKLSNARLFLCTPRSWAYLMVHLGLHPFEQIGPLDKLYTHFYERSLCSLIKELGWRPQPNPPITPAPTPCGPHSELRHRITLIYCYFLRRGASHGLAWEITLLPPRRAPHENSNPLTRIKSSMN